jgi:uncharacterized membrane protein YdbT with pleckstrin-like domain
MTNGVVIPKTWRSEMGNFGTFIVACPIAYKLTEWFPWTVVTGELFGIGERVFELSLPVLWFFPVAALLRGVYRIYNVRYTLDSRGIESRDGILNLQQRVVRIRYEDIRSIDVKQTLVDRFFDIGLLEASTAAQADAEIVMAGIAAPYELQRVVQLERDQRQLLKQREKIDPAANDDRSGSRR